MPSLITLPPLNGVLEYKVVQHVFDKGERNCLYENDELLCDSCDSVIAKHDETITVGQSCQRCHTPIVRLLPLEQFGQKPDSKMVRKATVAVVGLGYVGLPLVVEFGKRGPTIGYDITKETVEKCRSFVDPSDELSYAEMQASTYAEYTSNPNQLAHASYILVAVPTPVDSSNTPNFGPLIAASETIGKHMGRLATIIFESTVYPGATEEICIPVLERESGMKWKEDFFVGYSPERINPGDKQHSLTNTIKVVSGDTKETLDRVDELYSSIVTVGVYRASSIKVAEACKVIENTQRDLNIALMNELSMIFDLLHLDTQEVLEASGTKWNFLPFRPGLVGGHCIGVDPYYLTHKAEQLKYHPQIILAGRRINDSMGKYVAEQTIKHMIGSGKPIKGALVTVLGMAFKENCSDIRNTRVIDIVRELEEYGCHVQVHDPLIDPHYAQKHYQQKLTTWDSLELCDALILAVPHAQFLRQSMTLPQLLKPLEPNGIVMDVKSVLNAADIRSLGYRVWRL